jgi:hypothetical protein
VTDWSPGLQLGPYVLVSAIGAGDMGEVWKARDARLQRAVAIKRLTGPHLERFEQEARAIAALNHPNICQIYDVGPDYLVLEYIEVAIPDGQRTCWRSSGPAGPTEPRSRWQHSTWRVPRSTRPQTGPQRRLRSPIPPFSSSCARTRFTRPISSCHIVRAFALQSDAHLTVARLVHNPPPGSHVEPAVLACRAHNVAPHTVALRRMRNTEVSR